MLKLFYFIIISIFCSFVHADIKPIVNNEYQNDYVTEFFSYGCPTCNAFEPYLQTWRKQHSSVKFKRVAVGFHQAWKPLQKLYFTLESLNVDESFHAEVFKALHVNNEKLFTDDQIFKWISTKYDLNKFKQVYTSFTVDAKIKQAEHLIKAFNVDSVRHIKLTQI